MADLPDFAVESVELSPPLQCEAVGLTFPLEVRPHPRFERPLQASVRSAPLLTTLPWVRALGKLAMEVTMQGWRFPTPPDAAEGKRSEGTPPEGEEAKRGRGEEGTSAEDAPPDPTAALVPSSPLPLLPSSSTAETRRTRLKPSGQTVLFKDRLLYLLQPPLESLLAGKQVKLPLDPYPYQIQGIAFLMPRPAALLADEMGLGKTVQVIIALRLLFAAGLIRRALVVCPKPLVVNWSRELRTWAEDLPFEVIGGDTETRRAMWRVSNCPLKLVNYELLTRDAADVGDEQVHFDVVVLDEAQRIKSRESKTAQAARSIHRDRSWAMTGTPVENRIEDLVNIFEFVDPGRIPPDAPTKTLPDLTRDCILRRTKEQAAPDMPPRVYRDAFPELTPEQREAYALAETEGVVHLNELGDTITVQHVFELVLRLKQICNFDPRTGRSAKLEQLHADLAEVAESGRKAIVFSQWVEPLETLAQALAEFGPLLYHGKVPHKEREPLLDLFKRNPKKHVLLMSYGTGSVGLNLQFTNYVFLFDRWWNPAVEDQAINRAHRIGQKEPVFITRFVTPNTIEGRIAEVLEKKRELFNELIGQNGPPPSLGLSEDDVFGLFDLRARPRRAAA